MRVQLVLATISCPALLACSATSGEPVIPERGVTPGYTCQTNGLDTFVGQQANSETGATALKQSGAKSLRWIPPNSAVTMDYRQDRLNIEYNENMEIKRVNCG